MYILVVHMGKRPLTRHCSIGNVTQISDTQKEKVLFKHAMENCISTYSGHPKKRVVSCPAGGQNCARSGGRKIFFFVFGKKTVKIILQHRKQLFF